MPAKSEKQRKFMAVVREYKRGKRKNVGKKVMDAAKSMTDKEVTDFMHKEAAPPGHMLKKLLDTIGTSHIDPVGNADLQGALKYFGLNPHGMPTGNTITSQLIGRYRTHGGRSPRTKAVFSKAVDRPAAISDAYHGSESGIKSDFLNIQKERDMLAQLFRSVKGKAQGLAKESQAYDEAKQYLMDPDLATGLAGGALGTGGVAGMIAADKALSAKEDLMTRLESVRARLKHLHDTGAGWVDPVNRYRHMADTMDLFKRTMTEASPESSGILAHGHNRAALDVADALQPDMKRQIRETMGRMTPDEMMRFSGQDMISKLRQLGIRDYDLVDRIGLRQPQIDKAVAQAAGDMDKPVGTVLNDLKGRMRVNKVGKWASLIPILAGAGLLAKGTGVLGGGDEKSAQAREMDPEAKAQLHDMIQRAGAGTAIAGAGLASIPLYQYMRPTPTNVGVTYGTADVLGAGHKTPGQNLLRLLNATDAEGKQILDPRFRGYTFEEVPMSVHGVRGVTPLKDEYLAMIDTGWGAGGTKGKPYWNADIHRRPGFLGIDPEDIAKYDAGANIFFDPDPAVKGMGWDPRSFYAERLSKMKAQGGPSNIRELLHFGPSEDVAGLPGVKNIGPAHFGINPIDYRQEMSREDYKNMIVDELLGGKGDPQARQALLDEIGDKKIITISGASRGDDVGIKAKRLHDALKDAGELDKHFILGLGAKGHDVQRAIATAAGTEPLANTRIAPYSQKFVDLANRSDLHWMGMGGATPPEMIMHGGAPIVTDYNLARRFAEMPEEEWLKRVAAEGGDETAAAVKAFNQGYGGMSWSNVDKSLDPSAGIFGVRNKRIDDILESVQKGDIEIPDSVLRQLKEIRGESAKQWMIPSELVPVRNGERLTPVTASKGLDAAHKMLDEFGVRKVVTDARAGTKADPILEILRDEGYRTGGDTGKTWQEASDILRERIRQSQENYKNYMADVLDRAKTGIRKHRFWKNRNLGQAGAAMMALGIPAFLVSKYLTRAKEENAAPAEKTAQSMDNVPDWMTDKDLLIGAGATGLGGYTGLTAWDAARKASKLEELGNFVNLHKNIGLSGLTHTPEALPEYYTRYGQQVKDLLQNRGLFGMQVGTPLRHVPISDILKDDKSGISILKALKMAPSTAASILLPDSAADKTISGMFGEKYKDAFRNTQRHYRGYFDDPAVRQGEELWRDLGKNTGVTDDVLEAAGFKKELLAPNTDIWQRTNLMRKIHAGVPVEGISPELAKKMQPGVRELMHNALVNHATGGARLYGKYGKYAGGLVAALGALTGGVGIDRLRRYMKKREEGGQN